MQVNAGDFRYWERELQQLLETDMADLEGAIRQLAEIVRGVSADIAMMLEAEDG